MENKNTVIAVVLMLLVWIGFSVLFPPQKQPVDGPAVSQPTVKVEKVPTEKTAVAPPAASVAEAVVDRTDDAPVGEMREVIVETDTYVAVLSTGGARLKSFKLKKYRESSADDSPAVALIDVDQERLATLRTQGTDDLSLPADLLYNISFEGERIVVEGEQSVEVSFSATTADGLEITKVFTFRGNRYDFDLQVDLRNVSGTSRRGTVSLSLVHAWEEDKSGSRYSFVGPATLTEDEVQTVKVKDLEEESPSYQNPVWTAFEDKYFISAAVPLDDSAQVVKIGRAGETVVNALETPYFTLQPADSQHFDYLLYFGPRDLDILDQVNHQLDRAIDFGFFGVIALPLRHALTFFYKYVGNYGVAIILLTVIIKALFWPLTQKSYTSMKAMQKLQPEMQKIRERFKNDRERMNREIMEMYKKYRVNPLGGCLPMLIQIPVFFALYRVLLGDIALRQAPFALWLTDLSAKDPYYITPIIMGATMFIQQRMSPSSMDPTQAKMFMLMPVVFTFLFLNFPSGLVIYWLVNNLLTIAQQFLINRKA